jgi:Xaa-Pro dipeptidase
LYKPGESIVTAAKKADAIFSKAKRSMPHALGHGIGLEAHEPPTIRNRGDRANSFAQGMVVTLEPGLYSPVVGGCRLENDILITESGNETLTSSRIIRL